MDDVGVERQVFNSYRWKKRTGEGKAIAAYLRMAENSSSKWNRQLKAYEVFWILMPLALIVAALIVRSQLAIADPWRSSIAFGGAVLVGLLLAPIACRVSRSAQRMSRMTVLLKFGRCPSCAEELAAPRNDADTVECTGCASKWKSERVGNAADPVHVAEISPKADATFVDADDIPRGVARFIDIKRRLSVSSAAAEIDRETRLWRLFRVFATPWLVVAMWAIQRGRPDTEGLGLFTLIAVLLLWLLAACIYLPGRNGISAEVRATTLLKHGHCPSCLENVSTSDIKGVATCPKCSVRWKCRVTPQSSRSLEAVAS